MGDDIISNAQPVKLLDEQDNPYGVQSNPVVVQFNGSVGIVSVTGTVPVSFPTPVTVNGTVVAITSSPGTQPVQIVGQPVVVTVANPTGTVAISTNPVPIFGQVTVGSHAVGVVGPVTVNGTVAVSTSPLPVTVSGTQSVVVREQPIQVAGTVTALFNEGTELVRITGQPVSINGTVAISTSPVPVTFDSTGTLNTVIRQQPVQVFGTVVATGVSVSVSVGTVAISTNPVPVSFTGTVPVVVTGGTMSVSNTGTALTVNISSQSPGKPYSWNGYVQTALASPTLEYACRPNTYTPQPNGAARSIKSTSGHDQFAAGGGAKSVKLTYYSQTGMGDLTGPFEETINLNGLVAVNTSGSDIRYIEELQVYTTGTSGWNVGNLQIYTGTNGTGSVLATMSANDNQLFLGHHYVPSGYYCYIQDLQIAATAANNRIPYFDIHFKPLNLTNAAEQNILPFVKVTGYSGRYINYNSTHRVMGPGVITAYYTPTDNASQVGSVTVGCYEIPVT